MNWNCLQTGIPLNDTAHLRMGIAEVGESVLGPKLIGFQVGNEPDLYAAYVLFDSLSFLCLPF